MQLAARQILRAVRGTRSQKAFSRRLGYAGNPVADWEAGRRSPTAIETLRACDRVGIDVQQAFGRFHSAILERRDGSFDLGAWLSDIKGSRPTSEIAQNYPCDRQRVARWLRGATEPRLHEFLQLVDTITGRTCDLVAALVPIGRVPSLHPEYIRREAARMLAYEEPWTEAIVRLAEVVDGRMDRSAFVDAVVHTFALEPPVAERCLDKLEAASILVAESGGYRCGRSMTIDTRAVPTLKAHWCRVAQERLASPQPGDLFSYNVMAMSHEDAERIRNLMLATFREIRSIVENTPSEERVAVVNLQMMGWGER
jgi:DNA-binding phage protein